MSELQPEETLLTVAATITENEIATMISNSELGQLIEPHNTARLSATSDHMNSNTTPTDIGLINPI